jgi:hypothetical protein
LVRSEQVTKARSGVVVIISAQVPVIDVPDAEEIVKTIGLDDLEHRQWEEFRVAQ